MSEEPKDLEENKAQIEEVVDDSKLVGSNDGQDSGEKQLIDEVPADVSSKDEKAEKDDEKEKLSQPEPASGVLEGGTDEKSVESTDIDSSANKDEEEVPTPVEELSEIEKNAPANTPENPQPSIFKVTDADLREHKDYLLNFAGSKENRILDIKPFVNTAKVNKFEDRYVYTEKDPLGEKKVSQNGFLADGRKYIFNTFTLPGKGKRLYVLATEAARILVFRDSFMFFLKNKSLYKTLCNEEERKFLDLSGLSVSKIKSRSISIVSARALYIAFGARVVLSGKRIIDDYWEEQLTEQGLTPDDAVFPVNKRPRGPRRKKTTINPTKVTLVDPKLKLKLPTVSFVNPLPSLEDRKEYLVSTSNGVQSQVLPGQGITGSLELATVSSIPKYRNEGAHPTKHKNLLNSLSTSNTASSPVSIPTGNSLPIDTKLAGRRAINGLPYYGLSVSKRIASEDSEKLNEIEYLHSTVVTNHLISVGRKARNKQWKYYWQAKSGTTLGLTKDGAKDFLNAKEDFVNEVFSETTYNEYLNCDQVISKKKKPNPNFLNHGAITGLKPPYIDRPLNEEPVVMAQLQQGLPPRHQSEMNQNIHALQQQQQQQQQQQLQQQQLQQQLLLQQQQQQRAYLR